MFSLYPIDMNMFKRLFNSQRDRPRFFPDRNQINEINVSTSTKTKKRGKYDNSK